MCAAATRPFGTGGIKHAEQIGTRLGGSDGSLARLAHDGEDRAFHRVADCAVRTLGGGSQRRARRCAVDRCRIGDGGGEATKNLRHDHPAVATGAHERAMGDRLAHRCHIGVGAVELVDDRTQGERHVGAGVAVRDRIHVEVVHRLAVVDERARKTVTTWRSAVASRTFRGTASDRTRPTSPGGP